MEALQLQGVGLDLGSRTVLDAVDLELRLGEVVALVGPNGAGKTSLLRVAAGFAHATRGTVTLAGRAIRTWSRQEAARRLSVVPAHEDTVFPFSVREAVALGRHPWRSTFGELGAEDVEHIERALAATELLGLAERALTQLSAGERRRVAVARGVAQHAPVLLLDEPTAHLDLRQRERVLALIRDQADTHGRAVLVVMHDLNLAARVADRLVVLDGGRIAAEGHAADVLTPRLLDQVFGVDAQVLAPEGERALLVLPCAPSAGGA